jgi:hypothetical protein
MSALPLLNKRDLLQCLEEDFEYYLSATQLDEKECIDLLKDFLQKVRTLQDG